MGHLRWTGLYSEDKVVFVATNREEYVLYSCGFLAIEINKFE